MTYDFHKREYAEGGQQHPDSFRGLPRFARDLLGVHFSHPGSEDMSFKFSFDRWLDSNKGEYNLVAVNLFCGQPRRGPTYKIEFAEVVVCPENCVGMSSDLLNGVHSFMIERGLLFKGEELGRRVYHRISRDINLLE